MPLIASSRGRFILLPHVRYARQPKHLPLVSTGMRTLLVDPPLAAGPRRILGDEAYHGRTVLRLAPGDAVRIADGAGQASQAVVIGVDRHHLDVQLEPPAVVPEPPAHLLTVAVAPPKGDRWGDVVRGLTELGVGALQPLRCARGERLPSSDTRTQRIMAEAVKQCRRGHLPRLLPPIDVTQLAVADAEVIVLDPAGGPAHPAQPPRPTLLVIGPEGGLTADETAWLVRAGATRTRIATPILRIETAALAATAVWAAAWEHP